MPAMSSTETAQYREGVRALQAIGGWRSLFVLLAVLAPLTHLGAWAFVRFADEAAVPAPQVSRKMLASRPSASVLSKDDDDDADMGAGIGKTANDDDGIVVTARDLKAGNLNPIDQGGWKDSVRGALPVTMTLLEFVGRCAVVVLALTLLLGTLVVVSGGLPGAADVIRAFFVVVVVGFLFVPWDRMSQQDAPMPGVFTTRDALVAANPSLMDPSESEEPMKLGGTNMGTRGTWNHVTDGVRFAALPFISIIMLLTASGRFGRTLRLATARTGGGSIPLS